MITDKFNSSIVLKAISTIAKTNNPKEFAINNEVVYDVAAEAVRIMRSEFKGDLLNLSCMIYYDMIEEIMNTFDYSTGIALCTTEAQRCWYELGLEESSPMYYGRKIHPRVKLWAEAFDLALKQLGLK